MKKLLPFFRVVTLILIFFIILRCSTAKFMPGPGQIAAAEKMFPDTGSMYITDGYKFYLNKCGPCHVLYNPATYTAAEWERILPEMKEDARLNDEEYEKIRVYLVSMAKEGE